MSAVADAVTGVLEATLSAGDRKGLPGSAFVFPKDKRYPIHDLSHAKNALARASGKSEEGTVKAAVHKRYPQLKAQEAEVLEAARGGLVKCPECGTLNGKSSAKCKNCGKDMKQVAAKAKSDGRSQVKEAVAEVLEANARDAAASHARWLKWERSHGVTHHSSGPRTIGDKPARILSRSAAWREAAERGKINGSELGQKGPSNSRLEQALDNGAKVKHKVLDDSEHQDYELHAGNIARHERDRQMMGSLGKSLGTSDVGDHKPGDRVTVDRKQHYPGEGKISAVGPERDVNGHPHEHRGKVQVEYDASQQALGGLHHTNYGLPSHEWVHPTQLTKHKGKVKESAGSPMGEAILGVLESAETAALSVTHAPIGKGGKNWVTKSKPGNTGQLPAYIQNIRNAIIRGGKDESSATAIAVSRVKAWASGRGNVSAEVRAAAAKAVAEWEAMKAKSKTQESALSVAILEAMDEQAEELPDVEDEAAASAAEEEAKPRKLPGRERSGKWADLVTLATGRRATPVAEAVQEALAS